MFVIGTGKTGTWSITKALKILGYKTIRYPSLSKFWELVDKYEAATDASVTIHYKELDKKYPKAKFVCLQRDFNSWFKSIKKEMNKKKSLNKWQKEARIKLWGSSTFNKRNVKKGYYKINKDIKNHFKGRKDILFMNIIKGDGYEKLCPFLGKPILKRSFPHLHKSKQRK